MNPCNQFRLWLTWTRKFRRMAVAIAGPDYNNNRHAIKHHIRSRTRAVLAGFDQSAQTFLFRCDVSRLIQGDK